MSVLSQRLFGMHPDATDQKIINVANTVGKAVLTAVEAEIPGATAVVGAVETLAAGSGSTTAQKVAAGTTVITAIDPNALQQLENVYFKVAQDLGVTVNQTEFENLVSDGMSALGINVGTAVATVTTPAASTPAAAPATQVPNAASSASAPAAASPAPTDVFPTVGETEPA